MRLLYTGTQPTTFIGVGEIEPGAVLVVPDGQAEPFLRRPDVVEAPPEAAPDSAPPTPKPRKAPKTADQHIDAAAAAPEEG